jgi:hypothetical protein
MWKQLRFYFYSVGIGAGFLLAWNDFADIHWEHSGSIDIVSGAILEFFLFQLALFFFNDRQTKKMKCELDSHLTKIESLIKKEQIK